MIYSKTLINPVREHFPNQLECGTQMKVIFDKSYYFVHFVYKHKIFMSGAKK